MISANPSVPAGGSVHRNSGDMFTPSQVFCSGISPPEAKAGEVNSNRAGSGAATGVAVGSGAGVEVGAGVAVAIGSDVAVGGGAGVAVGTGVAVAIGSDVAVGGGAVAICSGVAVGGGAGVAVDAGVGVGTDARVAVGVGGALEAGRGTVTNADSSKPRRPRISILWAPGFTSRKTYRTIGSSVTTLLAAMPSRVTWIEAVEKNITDTLTVEPSTWTPSSCHSLGGLGVLVMVGLTEGTGVIVAAGKIGESRVAVAAGGRKEEVVAPPHATNRKITKSAISRIGNSLRGPYSTILYADIGEAGFQCPVETLVNK